VCVCARARMQVTRVHGLHGKFCDEKMSYTVFCCSLHFRYVVNLMFSGERGVDGLKVTNRYSW
jgi:hypothetical protein